MPTTRRTRTIAAPPDELWSTIADPYHLPRWWPRVDRVEGVTDRAFTQVLGTSKGRSVRADFQVLESRSPEVLRWAQDIQGTPFERILTAAETEVRLRPAREGTQVVLALTQKLRGFSRFGGFMVRGAARRQLDAALDALEALHGRP
jgi:uncharacterized protein YndB with AHSA1/START domain